MSDNFKNSKFNKGKGFTGDPNMNIKNINKEKNKNSKLLGLNNNNEKKNIDSLWGDYHKDYENENNIKRSQNFNENQEEDDLDGFKDDSQDDIIMMNKNDNYKALYQNIQKKIPDNSNNNQKKKLCSLYKEEIPQENEYENNNLSKSNNNEEEKEDEGEDFSND